MAYSNARQSYTSFDYQPVDCIPVIASFDSDGHIAPLYVRINSASYKVDSFWVRNSSFSNLITFNCKIIDGDTVRPLSLTYHQKECIWTMPKQ